MAECDESNWGHVRWYPQFLFDPVESVDAKETCCESFIDDGKEDVLHGSPGVHPPVRNVPVLIVGAGLVALGVAVSVRLLRDADEYVNR